MHDYLFKLVANSFKKIGQYSGLSYNEINVVFYYFIIPFSWLVLLDIFFDFHYLKGAFAIFTIGFFVGCRDFGKYSDWLFYKSVVFLNYFNKFGSNYIKSSIWICVSLPIAVYVTLFYIVLNK